MLSMSSEPNDPIWFFKISRSYYRAFELLWRTEFESRGAEEWDEGVLVYPVGFLLGHTIEMSLKGLILVSGGPAPKGSDGHDLEGLFSRVAIADVVPPMEAALQSIGVPAWFMHANPSVSASEATDLFRRHHLHIALLNRNYSSPYSVRYPNENGFLPFEPVALHAIANVLLSQLERELGRRVHH